MSSVARNTAFMTSASVIQKIITLVYFIIVARTLGVEEQGKYSLALSFTTIFVVFIDLGLTNVLIREAARYRDRLGEFFSTIISVKVLLAAVSYVGAVVAANLLGYPADIKLLIYASGVTMIFDSLHLTVYGALRAIGQLRWEAIGVVGAQLGTFLMGGLFLWIGLPVVWLFVAFIVPSFLNLCFAATILHKRFGISLKPHFRKSTFVHVSRIAIPFAIAAIFARVYSYVDTILLSKLVDTAAVGLYAVATKITFAFQFIPLALIAAVYPRMSEWYETNQERLAALVIQSLRYLLIVVLPISVGLGVIAPVLIPALFGAAYEASVLPLRLLLVSLVFSFLSFPVGACLNACDRQAVQTTIVGLVMVCNMLLNLLLIPFIGIEGAAIAASTGNVLLTVLGFWYMPEAVRRRIGQFFGHGVGPLVSAGIMGGCVWVALQYGGIAPAVITGAVVYPSFLFVTKSVTREQLIHARQLLGR